MWSAKHRKKGRESPAYAQSEMLASLQNSTGNERCDLRSITREGQKVQYPRKVKCWAKARCNLQNSNTELIRKTQAQSSEASQEKAGKSGICAKRNLGKVRCYPQNSSTELRSITREGRKVRYLRKSETWAKCGAIRKTQAQSSEA